MKVDGLRCDTCSKGWYAEPMRVGRLPLGWFSLTRGSNGLVEQDMHFCSLECLKDWASIQTIDARRIVGGPVQAKE